MSMVKSVITWESAFDGLTYGNKVSTLVTTTDHVTTSSNDLDYESACRFRSGAVYDPPTSYLGGVWQVWQGYGNFLWGSAKGIATIPYAAYHVVVHPVDSATTVWNVATSPGQVIHAIWSDFYNKAGSLKGQGEIAGEVITTIFTVGAGQAVSGASKAKMIANAPRGIDGGPLGFLTWSIPTLAGTLVCDWVGEYFIHSIVEGTVKSFMPGDISTFAMWVGFACYFGLCWLILRYLEQKQLFLKL